MSADKPRDLIGRAKRSLGALLSSRDTDDGSLVATIPFTPGPSSYPFSYQPLPERRFAVAGEDQGVANGCHGGAELRSGLGGGAGGVRQLPRPVLDAEAGERSGDPAYLCRFVVVPAHVANLLHCSANAR